MSNDDTCQKVRELEAAWFAGDAETVMYDACTEDPESAWQAILQILKHEMTEDQMALLAAGPMEDLLVWHGSEFIDRVEEKAKTDARFNYLLGGVWRREMPHEIWDRVVKVRKEVW